MRLNQKHAIQEFGWTLEQYDETDFFELNEVMASKERDERVQDPLSIG